MRVLTLDDMEIRQNFFRRWFREHEHHVALDAPTAIVLLDCSGRLEPVFDLVMLDHDLAEEHYLTASEGLSETGDDGYAPGTGMDVVDHIVKMPVEQRPKRVVVHSWNPTRSVEMFNRLRDAGIAVWKIPFNPTTPISLG